ncbi:citrate lyase ACP [Salmonella enterica subsp. enterica serovar Heidelberg]|nr:citrate lyase ACP [Salmonella enterica subsp. enterica serovar Heidelberg]
MKINQLAVAGTLESGDVMIRIAPLDTQDIDLQINSSVEKTVLARPFAPPSWRCFLATTCAAYN